MTIYNPLPLDSVVIIYPTIILFSTLLYIGYNCFNSYYESLPQNQSMKKKMSKYVMVEIKLDNIENYFDKDNFDMEFEQISTNAMYVTKGLFALSYYNKLYILVEREDMFSDKEKYIEDICIMVLDKIKNKINDVNCLIDINLYITYTNVENNNLGAQIKKIIRRNKLNFMKYISKQSGINFSKKLPYTNKNMNKFYKKYSKQCGVNYLESPYYAVCYKRISDKEAVVFKSELRMFDQEELDKFITRQEVSNSEIYENPKMYDSHYVENELYNVYTDADSSDNSSESDESEESENDNVDSNVDSNVEPLVEPTIEINSEDEDKEDNDDMPPLELNTIKEENNPGSETGSEIEIAENDIENID